MTVPVLVAVDAPLAVGDAALTYAAPEAIAPGAAVLVPLRSRLTVGYALGVEAPSARPLRQIITILSDIPALPPDLLALARWMSDFYLCSVGEAIAAMLPPGLIRRVRVQVSLASDLTRPARRRGLETRGVDVDGLHRAIGPAAAAQLARWLAQGTARLRVALPRPRRHGPGSRPPTRLRVHPALWSPSANGRRDVLLLSAEREGTYLAAVGETLRRGQSALALFASVAAAERFAARARDVLRAEVILLHGGLSDDERLSRWLAVRAGAGTIVAGTRAAVFAPLDRVGLLIADEENDIGHREERVPRYHVREVARRRAEQAGATLLLADQVLSAETYALAGRPGVELLRPPTSGGTRTVIVDLRRREQAPQAEVLSVPLVSALQRVAQEGGRAVLFVNRKGYAGMLVCADCGYAPHCARCEVSLRYDAREGTLLCPYCHDRYPPPSVCPRCGGRVFIPRGSGTQRVARLAQALRAGPVLRLDSDAAPTRADVTRLLRRFREQGGIVVTTALLLEADDPPRVDLAGVVLADASLRYPDYRAPEHGLRTLWQVRSLTRKWYIVQTYAPDHPALLALRRGDLRLFYREELRIRRDFHYPPYGEVLSVEIVGPETRAREAATSLAAVAGREVEVLGPAPLRRGRASRWQVMFRGNGPVPREPLLAWLRRPPSRVRVAVDVNP